VPEENFWTLWCKGRLTEADTPTIRLGATPSGLNSECPPPASCLQCSDVVGWVGCPVKKYGGTSKWTHRPE